MENIKPIKWPEYFIWNFDYPPIPSFQGRSRINLEGGNYHGRFIFDKADSIKQSRGEYFPYAINQGLNREIGDSVIYEVSNSNWLQERYLYEKKHYGSAYEFGGTVDEMILEYRHYLIPFEDEFVEILARGFWYEWNSEPFKQQFLKDNPLDNLAKNDPIVIENGSLRGHVYQNKLSVEELHERTLYCPQKMLQFGIEINGRVSISRTLLVMRDNQNRIYSSLRGSFNEELERHHAKVGLSDIEQSLKKYMGEVEARRNKN